MHSDDLPPLDLYVGDLSGILRAQRQTKEYASKLGFGAEACEELGIVAAELCSNLAKYGRDGRLRIFTAVESSRMGIAIVSQDAGVGITDIEYALTDGASSAGTLGGGLGAVNRLMDDLYFESEPSSPHRFRIRCVRWLPRHPGPVALPSCPLQIGTATRAHPGEAVNGDDFVVQVARDYALVAVIDGLGHGPGAHSASNAVRRWVERHSDQPIPSIFAGASRACAGTQGAVMAVAKFDWANHRLHFGSLGNVEARVFRHPALSRPHVQRGILGRACLQVRSCTYPWTDSAVLILHSDGIHPGWHWDEIAFSRTEDATLWAQRLVRSHARATDDATAVVVRSRP